MTNSRQSHSCRFYLATILLGTRIRAAPAADFKSATTGHGAFNDPIRYSEA